MNEGRIALNYTVLSDTKTSTDRIVGSFDHSEPTQQMHLIDTALVLYFESQNWLKVRNTAFPGLTRLSTKTDPFTSA